MLKHRLRFGQMVMGEIDLLQRRDLKSRQFKMAVEMGDEKGKVYLK
jgi:hypothetical protein